MRNILADDTHSNHSSMLCMICRQRISWRDLIAGRVKLASNCQRIYHERHVTNTLLFSGEFVAAFCSEARRN